MVRPSPTSTLFPYTTLFRSHAQRRRRARRHRHRSSAACRRRRSEEHTSELQSHVNIVCRLMLEKKKKQPTSTLCFTHINILMKTYIFCIRLSSFLKN